MARLESLRLIARRAHEGVRNGERRSVRRGTSQEFADHRSYVTGDDLRFIDWNLYGRLDKLFIKLFLEEEDLVLALVVDTSASMGFGAPETKLRLALRLALSLGYIALLNQEKVALLGGGDRLVSIDATVRGKSGLFPLVQALEKFKAEGKTNLNNILSRCGELLKKSGIIVVFSDLLDVEGYDDGVLNLSSRGHEVILIHTLCSDELKPQLEGDLSLKDSETGDLLDVTFSPQMREYYTNALSNFLNRSREFALKHGFSYILWDGLASIETMVTTVLRERGILK
ncbi:DUF58 domain-containing protein [bacterium]|nr:DUF58 domain-containing protein [bacterium]